MQLGMGKSDWAYSKVRVVWLRANAMDRVQLSFVTTTVFGTGQAPTETITALASTVTQMVTMTVMQTAACAGAAQAASPAASSKETSVAVLSSSSLAALVSSATTAATTTAAQANNPAVVASTTSTALAGKYTSYV
jgi:hypothetical protein